MRKISDYIRHAEECRKLALTADTAEHKQTLLSMADTWLELAAARTEEIARKERVSHLGTPTNKAATDR